MDPGDIVSGRIAIERPAASGGAAQASTAFPVDIARLLADHYDRVPTSIALARCGHTNRTAFVDCGSELLVLRCSWAGKPRDEIAREERLLAHLHAGAPEIPAPRIVPTRTGDLHVRVPDPPRDPRDLRDCDDSLRGAGRPGVGPRFVHLFRRLPGEPRYGWRGPCSAEHARAAGAVLARLHAALRGAPDAPAADPLAATRERLVRIDRAAARASSLGLDRALADSMASFFAIAEALIDEARGLVGDGPVQWVHGDFQLENLLFYGGDVSGVVDFDGARAGTPGLDLAFALFSVARCGHIERAFTFDDALFRAGLEGYRSAAQEIGFRDWPVDRAPLIDRLERLYCLDQALMHLDADARGIWRLAPGIGFLPCARRVLA